MQLYLWWQHWQQECKFQKFLPPFADFKVLSYFNFNHKNCFRSKRNPSPQFEGPIGKFAINVCGVPEKSEILDHFEHVIRNLVLRTLTLNASIDTLQSWKLTPKLDMYDNQNLWDIDLFSLSEYKYT